jgi:hypothetical protein
MADSRRPVSEEHSPERELEREERRLRRLRLVVSLHQKPEEDPEDDFDPEPQEAA